MTAATASSAPSDSARRSLVPARLDRLPWSRFHWLIIIGLGVAWILDGLEIQIVAQAGYQKDLALSNGQVGFVGTVYLLGEVFGALVFGRITDRLGRKKLFMVTLALYLVASAIAGLSPTYWFLLVFRFFAGAGIGGEYAAINAAIDELIPSHYRGRVDIAINGTYWAGAAIGAGANLYFLSSHVPSGLGWRLSFFIGPVIGIAIILLRRTIPESPRWLMTHGRHEEAEQAVDDIEARVRAQGIQLDEVPEDKAIDVTPTDRVGFIQITKIFFGTYPRRSILGFAMMASQAFLYNAIFFTYALVLEHFYGVSSGNTSYYFFPFAVGQSDRPAAARQAVRHGRTAAHDQFDLRAVGGAPARLGIPLPRRRAERDHPDRAVVRDLLHRLGRCFVGIPDGQRDLPARTARPGDFVLLRDRTGHRRLARSVDLRPSHRRRTQHASRSRAPHWGYVGAAWS